MLKMPTVHLRQAMSDPGLMIALAAEMVGAALFQLLTASHAGIEPLQVGFSLAAIMYSIKFVSGGHVNPAVSLAAASSGHIDWTRGLMYTLAQVLGGIVGAMFSVALVPGTRFGHESAACLVPGRGVGDGRLFGWELLLTAFFLLVMYSCVFVRPGHGDAAPLAGGVSLVAALSAGGRYTGYSPLSPARVLASSLIFNCAWRHAWVYLLAELLGAAAAVLVVLAVYGRGPHYTGERATDALRESLLMGGPADAPFGMPQPGMGGAGAGGAVGMEAGGGGGGASAMERYT